MLESRVGPGLDSLLSLRSLGERRFASQAAQINRNGFSYGGQILAQALTAAAHTIDGDRLPHVLQASFERPARADEPVVYAIEAVHNGGSLSSRRLVARQCDSVVLNGNVSFCAKETGFVHQSSPTTTTVPPDALEPLSDIAARFAGRVSQHGRGRLTTYAQVEVRPINIEEHLLLREGNAASRFWIRALGALPQSPSGRAAVMAYLSDYLLINAALIPHVGDMPEERLFVASLNHSIWFHELPDPAQWMLYESTSPWAAGGRALSLGRFFSRQGSLIASTAQEAMVRVRAQPMHPAAPS